MLKLAPCHTGLVTGQRTSGNWVTSEKWVKVKLVSLLRCRLKQRGTTFYFEGQWTPFLPLFQVLLLAGSECLSTSCCLPCQIWATMTFCYWPNHKEVPSFQYNTFFPSNQRLPVGYQGVTNCSLCFCDWAESDIKHPTTSPIQSKPLT